MRRLLVLLPLALLAAPACFLFGTEESAPAEEPPATGGSGGGGGSLGCESDDDCGVGEECVSGACELASTAAECEGRPGLEGKPGLPGKPGLWYFDAATRTCVPRQQLAVGPAHVCAVRRSDDRLFCRGEDESRQLGSGRANGSAPERVHSWVEVKRDSWLPPVGELLPLDGRVVQVAASDDTTCAVFEGSAASLLCWGENDWRTAGWSNVRANDSEQFSRDGAQQIGPSPEQSDIVGATQVALGARHGCAVASGRVRCWGSSWDGGASERSCRPFDREEWAIDPQATTTGDRCSTRAKPVTLPADAQVPPGASLAAGRDFTCAIAGPDHRLACWGAVVSADVPPTWVSTRPPERPDGGDESALAVQVHDWVTPPEGARALDELRLVAAGARHVCVVRSPDGGEEELICFGANEAGQAGGTAETAWSGGATVRARVVPLPLVGRIEALAAGPDFTCVLQDGWLTCFGHNAAGQVGQPPTEATLIRAPIGAADEPDPDGRPFALVEPIQLPAGRPWIHLSAGGERVCALGVDGDVACLGPGDEAGLRVRPPSVVLPGTMADGELLPPGTRLAAEGSSTCLYRSDEVACAGEFPIGWAQLDLRGSARGFVPVRHADGAAPRGVLRVSVGGASSCIEDDRGSGCFGHTVSGRALGGEEPPLLRSTIGPVAPPAGAVPVRAVPSQDDAASCLILQDGGLACAGQDNALQVSAGPSRAPVAGTPWPRAKIALSLSGAPATSRTLARGRLPGGADALPIVLGATGGCRLNGATGTPVCWAGALLPGQSDPTVRGGGASAPLVGPIPGVLDVAAGLYFSCLIAARDPAQPSLGGGIACWGGFTGRPSVPDGGDGVATGPEPLAFPAELPAPPDDFVALAMQEGVGCGLRAGGEVWCFGQTNARQLGTDPGPDWCGDVDCTRTAVRLALSGPAKQLSAQWSNVCATLQDGRVECFGADAFGQFGSGVGWDPARRLASATPLPLPAGVVAAEVALGRDFVCVRTDEGSPRVLCAGAGQLGQLGRGPLAGAEGEASLQPVVGPDGAPLTDVAALAVGLDTACAIAGPERRWSCWGALQVDAPVPDPELQRCTSDGATIPCSLVARPVLDAAGAPVDGRSTLFVAEQVACASGPSWDVRCVTGAGGPREGLPVPLPAPYCRRAGDEAYEPCVPEPLRVELPGGVGRVTDVSSAWINTCLVDDAGAAWCWGPGDWAARGLAGPRPAADAPPTRVALPVPVEKVELGRDFGCALEAAGGRRVFCWGTNRNDQLARGSSGDGTLGVPDLLLESDVPAPVLFVRPGVETPVELTQVRELGCGHAGCCARYDAPDAVGEIACWGHGRTGFMDAVDQTLLGQGSRLRLLWSAERPVALAIEGTVPGSTLACSYALGVGDAHACALVAIGPDGACAPEPDAASAERRLVCWGRNDRGAHGRLRASPHLPLALPPMPGD